MGTAFAKMAYSLISSDKKAIGSLGLIIVFKLSINEKISLCKSLKVYDLLNVFKATRSLAISLFFSIQECIII